MDNEKCRLLIKLYGSRELLWNSKLKNYHNKSLRAESWREISAQMGIPVPELKKKMTTLLASYRKEKSRIVKSYISASGKVYVSKWFGFDDFSFMKNKNISRLTFDTMPQTLQMKGGNELHHKAENETHSTSKMTEEVECSNTNRTNETAVNLPIRHYKIPEESLQKRQKINLNKKYLKLAKASKILTQTSTYTDPYYSFGQHIANELRKYDSRTLARVKQTINNIIFEADMGHYTRSYGSNPHIYGQISNQPSTLSPCKRIEISSPETISINADIDSIDRC